MRVVGIAFFFLSLSARAEDALRVRAQITTAPRAVVRLGQLVEQPELLGPDASIVISKGLTANSSERVSPAKLAQVLRPVITRARAEGHELHLVLPARTVITANSHDFNAVNVAAELIQGWQAQCAECRFEIENLNLPQILNIRDWSIKVLPALPRGTFSVALTLDRADAAATTGWVNGRLLVKRRVPVARRLLQMGERVTPDDFAMEFRDTAQAYDGVPNASEVTGRKLRRGVALGDVMWQGTLERDRAIHRGDQVQLRAATTDWEVSLSVVAPQDGFVGDVINFKNTKTNNVVIGRVTGPGQAEIQ